MLTVHHLNNSRSQRVLWLLEELEVPYEVKRYQRGPDMRAPAALKDIHPLGKSPVLTDGTRTIAESGAILEYILATYGEGRLAPPPATEDHLRFTYWLHYAEGSAMTLLYLKLMVSTLPKSAPEATKDAAKNMVDGFLKAAVDPQLKTHMDFWEAELARTGWFAGDEFTAADIQMSYPLEAAANRAGLADGHPSAMAFLERIHARPAYQRAEEQGGPGRPLA